jgi:hypothetical protein
LPIPPGVAPGGSFAEFQATASSTRNANCFALAFWRPSTCVPLVRPEGINTEAIE